MVLLRQLSYAIKTQLKPPKALSFSCAFLAFLFVFMALGKPPYTERLNYKAVLMLISDLWSGPLCRPGFVTQVVTISSVADISPAGPARSSTSPVPASFHSRWFWWREGGATSAGVSSLGMFCSWEGKLAAEATGVNLPLRGSLQTGRHLKRTSTCPTD